MTIQAPNRILLLSVAATLLLSACEKEPPAQGRPARGGAVRVVTALVELRPMIDEIQALGTASANESIEIQPRIASRLERVAFEEGQMVAKGDLLVELENSEIVAGLALARASLSESQSIYDRSKSLASTQAISASNLDQLSAQVKVNEAQVQAARARLDNTVIRAPFSGRVGLRRVSPGSFVNSQTIITTLDDVEKIKLDFSVPETFMTVVTQGMRIVAQSIVYPDRTFEGTVASIDTRLDPISRAVGVRAVIPNDDGALKPGMFMTIELQRDQGEVLLVPEQSIVPEGSIQYVFVVDEGVVRKQAVVIARRIPGFVVISDGVKENERVVTEGTGKVRDGASVEEISNADF
jgi:membrane fusion protein (multidrug efflux system)